MSDPFVFIPVFLGFMGLFAWSCYQKFSVLKYAAAENRFDNILKRIGAAWNFAIRQKRVVAGPFGINHAVLFWSFLVLVLLNGEFLLNGLVPAISFQLLPDIVLYPLKGVFDIVSVVVLVAVVAAVIRRVVNPPYPESRTFEAFFILGMIAVLMVAYFTLNAAEIVMGEYQSSVLMPLSSALALWLQSFGESSVHTIAQFSWWIHAIVLLVFMNFLPHSKHMHILTAIPNCFFKALAKPVTVPRERFEKGATFGADQVNQLSWKDLFDSYTCTECGRCQQHCPAFNTDKPLNPRTMIHAIKENLGKNAENLRLGQAPTSPLIANDDPCGVSEDVIWSCVTCGACMEQCPVFIEHVPKIVKMRRNLVETKAKFPNELLNFFENMEQRSNPWGIAPPERTKWYAHMDVKPFEKDETEYLFYVGCAGAFDARSKQVTLALAMILDRAGISWGVLGKEELCCGDSARRLGNEYLFEQMALKNVELFKEKGVKKIITICPHCFTTLGSDYRQFGLDLDVVHHSEFIRQLLDDNRIALKGENQEFGKVTVHDSCYLGRHNGIYDAPRTVVQKVTKNKVTEMEKNREKSFCCGAGGGRMWLEELEGSRMNIERVKQAQETNADSVCVSCPYCLTMFEDGAKEDMKGQLRIYDLAEIVARSLN